MDQLFYQYVPMSNFQKIEEKMRKKKKRKKKKKKKKKERRHTETNGGPSGGLMRRLLSTMTFLLRVQCARHLRFNGGWEWHREHRAKSRRERRAAPGCVALRGAIGKGEGKGRIMARHGDRGCGVFFKYCRHSKQARLE